uniref:Uncharacterized protein n=1 Tax=Babesia bovis TaxID=5865 RepID=S6C981_BABBO|nr:hypothetical protein [Babesia bovis]
MLLGRDQQVVLTVTGQKRIWHPTTSLFLTLLYLHEFLVSLPQTTFWLLIRDTNRGLSIRKCLCL